MKRFEIFFGVVKVPLDFIMTILAFLLAYKLRLITDASSLFAKPIDLSVLPTINEYLAFSIGAAIAFVIISALGKSYNLKTTFHFTSEIKRTIILGGIWAMAMVTYFFFLRIFPFSRLAMFYSWGLTIVFIIGGRGLMRIVQHTYLKAGIGQRRLLFIGNNRTTEEMNEKLAENLSYKIVGVVGKRKQSSIPYLGEISELEKIIRKQGVDEVIQTRSDISEIQSEDILEICDLHHVNYRFIPDLVEVRRTNIEVQTIGGIPLISLKSTPLDGWGKVYKRIMDISGALSGFIILSPIFLITSIAIKLESKGPILFSRLDDGSPVKRVGHKGKLLKFYKFRSMYPLTDSLRYTKLASQNLREGGPLVKIQNDPRVTKVGQFIRKYSIDELPQLWNVLIGSMSLVGPRPHLPEEVAKYKKHHRFVLTIKPGLTGLPQTSGRSDLTFEDEVKLDRYYIENWTIWLDIKLILKTLGVILKGYKE